MLTGLDPARRKISPTYQERMIWGQGDGSGLRASTVRLGVWSTGMLGTLQSSARYVMMADGEQIHSAMYPGSIFRRPVQPADGN